jgi:hypothetical protein
VWWSDQEGVMIEDLMTLKEFEQHANEIEKCDVGYIDHSDWWSDLEK